MLVSVGFRHDGTVRVWDWELSTEVAEAKVAGKVYALSFHEDGLHFATAGDEGVDFWCLDEASGLGAGTASPVQLTRRKAALQEQLAESTFVDVACGTRSDRDNT